MDTPTIPELTLRHRLRIARDEAGITTSGMAKHFRVSRHTITNWERGRSVPRAIELEKWADLTGVDLDWLDPEHGIRSRCSAEGAAS